MLVLRPHFVRFSLVLGAAAKRYSLLRIPPVPSLSHASFVGKQLYPRTTWLAPRSSSKNTMPAETNKGETIALFGAHHGADGQSRAAPGSGARILYAVRALVVRTAATQQSNCPRNTTAKHENQPH